MNDIPKKDWPKNWPVLSLDEAHARLTAPGARFETMDAVIRGVTMTVWKHVPATAREAFQLARAHGSREFLIYQDERVSYEAFVRATARLAAHLHEQGLKKGDRVALVMRNLPEWPVVFMASLLAGAIIVPLNAWWSGTELAYGILDSGARFVFADGERLTRLKDLPPAVEKIFVTRGEGAPALEDVIGTPASWHALPNTRRTTLIAVPFFHVIGSLSILLPNMAAGGTLVLMRKFDPQAALRLIESERVTVTGGVPAIALSLLDQAGDHDLSSLQLVTYGGAPSPASLAGRIHGQMGAMPGQGWGMTETSATYTSHSGADFLHRPASCGPALPVSRIKVMQGGVEAPPGLVGELWAFGPNIVKGYWNRPETTAESFDSGWLATGDLASLDVEGFCTILDRSHDMVIRGGENIYCIEVENILSEHPAVADVALVGLPHPLLGEVPAALVQARPGAQINAAMLQDFVRARLAEFKVPVAVLIVGEALPRNAGGKLVKSELRKAFGA